MLRKRADCLSLLYFGLCWPCVLKTHFLLDNNMSPDTGDRDVYRGRIIRCYFLVKLWMGFRLYVLNESLESLESEIRLSCDKDRNDHTS